MKALILAAGNGTRMQPVTKGQHKSLMPLLGLKIIERVILGAKNAGIFEFVIVTGYKGKELRDFLGKGRKYGVSISFVQNPNWEKANGISALIAKDYFKENFALLMSDHVFDPNTLRKIKRIKLGKNECILAIDKNLDRVLDVADTTKVIAKGGKIIKLHKKLDKYNAYDTGMFLCSPHIFEILKKTTDMEKNSLSDGMRALAKEGNLRYMNNNGNFWSDCDTWEDIKFAKTKLIKSLTKERDGVVSKNFNRKISTYISKYLVNTSISPNIISFLIPILALFTFFVLAKGGYPWLIFGGVFIQFLSIIDGVDGELSRLKFTGSTWGAWLDPILDRYVVVLIIAGMALGYWNMTGDINILLVAIFAIFSEVMLDYMPSKFVEITRTRINSKDFPFSRDTRMLILAIGTVLNQIFITLVILIILSQIKSVHRIIVAKRRTEAKISSNNSINP